MSIEAGVQFLFSKAPICKGFHIALVLLTGAGQIGMAIARRMGSGMKIVVGDKKMENAQAIAKIMNEAGFDVVPVEMDLSSRESIKALIAEGQKYGEIKMLVNAAGVSPSQAPIEAILKVDLYGTAVLLEEVGRVIAPGISVTPLALDEFNGPRGDFYKNMFANCPAGRPGTADEVANVAELLMSDKSAFIIGSTFLIDGGATASYFYGPLKPKKEETAS